MSWREKIKRLLHNLRYVKQERGAVFVLTALLLPVLIGCLGFAYDAGNLYMHKARLQNVTDAAALAGGAVFGEKAQGTDSRRGNTITLTGKHKDADDVAKDYVNKNKINLGNNILVEELSALGYQGDVDENATTGVKTQSTDVYYRVIASEQVPLYFLPIIFDKREQTVRAVSVALTKTTKTITPGSDQENDGNQLKVPNSSIFDNLYTYSEYFDAGLATTGRDVNASFKGNMIFTYGDGAGTDKNYYYIPAIMEQKYKAQHYVDHLFDDKDADVTGVQSDILNGSGSNKSWANVNDPIINTYFDTTVYETVFRDLLKKEHVNVINKSALTDTNINNPNSSLYTTNVKLDGNQVYKAKAGNNDEITFLKKNGRFYAYDDENSDYAYIAGREHVESNRVEYMELYDRGGKHSAAYVEENGKKWLLDKNYAVTDSYFKDGQVYEGNQKPYIFILDLQNNSQDGNKYQKSVLSNVFYFSADYLGSDNSPVEISIKNPITIDNGKKDEPIYVIIENNVKKEASSVKLHIANNVRPIIVIYFGEKNILFTGEDNKEANLTVYAPYGTFGRTKDNEQINFTSTFKGNVIAKGIAIQAGGGGTWVVKNHFKTEDGKYKNDDVSKAIKKIDDGIESEIKQNNQQLPDSVKDAIADAYKSVFGVTKEELKAELFRDKDKTDAENDEQKKKNKLSYSQLGYEKKQDLYTAWKGLVADYPAYKDMLWPWNDHFDLDLTTTVTPGQPTTTSESTLRLINPRTENNPYFTSSSDI